MNNIQQNLGRFDKNRNNDNFKKALKMLSTLQS